ncbi:MAG: hypothetical protein F6K24_12600 [Okeania sp. SIO2D1]|nr:hypothetical protein [Okeania sp. SIO2D1]
MNKKEERRGKREKGKRKNVALSEFLGFHMSAYSRRKEEEGRRKREKGKM